MAGRPTSHTPEVEAEIFTRLSAGESLRAICKAEHLPPDPTVRNWIVNDKPPGISARYAHARALGLDAMAEETIEISEEKDDDPASRRVRVDTRKWLLSKLAPKKYGDRIEIAGDKENPLEISIHGKELLTSRIDSLIARSRTDEPATESD
jgi:hypothetical protein